MSKRQAAEQGGRSNSKGKGRALVQSENAVRDAQELQLWQQDAPPTQQEVDQELEQLCHRFERAPRATRTSAAAGAQLLNEGIVTKAQR
jgi:hypothetical protein